MMIYRAVRPLLVVPRGTDQEIRYQPGDIIPDFHKWDEVSRRAHLNQSYVAMDIPPVTSGAAAADPAAEPAEKGKGKGKKKAAAPEPPPDPVPPEPDEPPVQDPDLYDPLLDPEAVLG